MLTIRRDCAFGCSTRRRIVLAKIFKNIILNQRVASPSVHTEVLESGQSWSVYCGLSLCIEDDTHSITIVDWAPRSRV